MVVVDQIQPDETSLKNDQIKIFISGSVHIARKKFSSPIVSEFFSEPRSFLSPSPLPPVALYRTYTGKASRC